MKPGWRSRLLLAALAVSPVLGAEERIVEFDSDIRLHPDGQLTVTETIRVRAENRNIRHGIYRDFPTRYEDSLGNRYRVDFYVVSVARNGGREPWHQRERSNGVRVYMGSADRMVEPGLHEYELVYLSNRQLGFFDDHDELYWNVTGNGWAFPIDHASVDITLPFRVQADELRLSAYTGPYGSRDSDAVAEIPAPNRVRFETTRPLEPREGLTVAVGWPKGLVDEPGPAQKIRWFFGDNGGALVLLLGLLSPLLWYLWAWKRVGRDPEAGIIIPRFKPPKGLSPAACRYVRDMSFDRNAFSAAIISLAVKGAILIEEDGDDFVLHRVSERGIQPLTPGESGVLQELLPHAGSRLELDDSNHEAFQAARKALRDALKKEYRGRLFHLNGIYLLPPILLTIAAAGIAWFLEAGTAVWIGFFMLSIALHLLFLFLMRAPTPAGRQVMDEIEGFRRYLETAERDRLDRMRSPELTPELFESFLPYAYALGVENQWCRSFAREVAQGASAEEAYQPRWYAGRFAGTDTLSHLGSGFSRSFSSAISSASSPPGSSSGAGGGGFSGGGGGGGGGGGW